MSVCNISPEVPVLRGRNIKMVRGLIKDASWVVATVDNLRVIEKVFKEKEVAEEEKSCDSINNVISCLRTLDNCRLQLHEELEIQSIQGFVQKQTYMNLPNQIQALMEASIRCTRKEAERHYEKCRNEERFLNTDIERMKKEISQIEVENWSLPLEQRETEEEESQIIDDFNIRLQHKLKLKEKLRKMREQIRNENQKIVLIETDILKMKDDLIKQREKAKKEMDYYKSQIGGVQDRKNEWKAKVNTVKPEYKEVMTSLKSSDKSIEEIKTEVKSEGHKMNTSSRLRGSVKNKMQLEMKLRDCFSLKQNQNRKEMASLKVGFEKELAKKLESYHELELKIMFEKSRRKELEVNETEIGKVFTFFLEIEENARHKWKAVKDKLDMLQSTLSQLESELVNCVGEQTEVVETSDELELALNAQILQMMVLIDTLIDTLNLKKKVRVEIEALEERILKQLEETKEEKDLFKVETKKFIKQLEVEHHTKINDVKVLQSFLKNTVSQIRIRVAEVQVMHDKHDDECRKKETLIKQVEDDADEQEKMLIDFHTKFEEMSNPFQHLASQYKQYLKEYSSIYAKHTHDKSQLDHLMEFTATAELQLMTVHKTKAKLERGIKILSDEYVDVLKRTMQQTNEIEEEIYKQTCRLKFLKLENYILKKGIEDHRQMIEDTENINRNETILQELLKRLLRQLKKGFIRRMKKMEETEEIALERDKPLIVHYHIVFEIIHYNRALVRSVLPQLCQKMDKLNSKWGNIEKMRPVKESAKKIVSRISQSSMKPEM